MGYKDWLRDYGAYSQTIWSIVTLQERRIAIDTIFSMVL